MSAEEVRVKMKALCALVVIPTYNNVWTIAAVVADALNYSDEVLVVNDGSTDNTIEILQGLQNVRLISYEKNRGKGFALKRALKYADEQGFRYAVTIDADGQHFAKDIAVFVEEIEKTPDALLVGARNIEAENMPSKNTFANKFSNFWFLIETGRRMSDTQSGFRLYPVRKLKGMVFFTPRYEFEVEVLVRAVWRGIEVRNIPIEVYYPPQQERVSHFRPLKDFTRISILNTFLVIGALLFYYPWTFVRSLTRENIRKFIEKNITKSPDSNAKVASAFGLGIFFGIIPIWGYQMVAAGVTAHFLKLNKVLTVIASNISIPPMIPFILFGSYAVGGWVMGRELILKFSDISLENMGNYLSQYLFGSVILAVAAGSLVWVVSYLLMVIFKRKSGYNE